MKSNLQRFFSWIKKLPLVVKFYIVIAIAAPVLANEKPLIIKYNGEFSLPAFNGQPYFKLKNENGESTLVRTESVDWKNLTNDFILFPPIAWSAGRSDLENANYVSPYGDQYYSSTDHKLLPLPFSKRHFLGTTRTGEDVLAGLIHGTRFSLFTGFASMAIAGIFGLLIGGLAGYFGDHDLKTQRWKLVTMFILIIPAWYYCFTLQSTSITNSFHSSFAMGILRILLSTILFLLLILFPQFINKKINTENFFTQKISIPVDFMTMRAIEIFLSMPRMILILTIAAITRPSLTTLIMIIGLTSWTDIARIVRAEILKLKKVEFIDAGRSIGLSTPRIIIDHIMPNIMPVVMTFLIYGVASAILLETGLSFLGIGLPAGSVTWGTIMYAAKENFSAWWLVIFPGAAIALLLISLNTYGKKFR